MRPVRNNDMDKQTDALRLIYRLPGCCCLIYYLSSVKCAIAQIYLEFKYIITNQNGLTKNNNLVI